MDERLANPARAGMQQRQSALSCRSPLTLFFNIMACDGHSCFRDLVKEVIESDASRSF